MAIGEDQSLGARFAVRFVFNNFTTDFSLPRSISTRKERELALCIDPVKHKMISLDATTIATAIAVTESELIDF